MILFGFILVDYQAVIIGINILSLETGASLCVTKHFTGTSIGSQMDLYTNNR